MNRQDQPRATGRTRGQRAAIAVFSLHADTISFGAELNSVSESLFVGVGRSVEPPHAANEASAVATSAGAKWRNLISHEVT